MLRERTRKRKRERKLLYKERTLEKQRDQVKRIDSEVEERFQRLQRT